MAHRYNTVGTPKLAFPDVAKTSSVDWVVGDAFSGVAEAPKILQPRAALRRTNDTYIHNHFATVALTAGQSLAVGQCLNLQDIAEVDSEIIEYTISSSCQMSVPQGIRLEPFVAVSENVAASDSDVITGKHKVIPLPTDVVNYVTDGTDYQAQMAAQGIGAVTSGGIEQATVYVFVGVLLTAAFACNLESCRTVQSIRRYDTNSYPNYANWR